MNTSAENIAQKIDHLLLSWLNDGIPTGMKKPGGEPLMRGVGPYEAKLIMDWVDLSHRLGRSTPKPTAATT